MRLGKLTGERPRRGATPDSLLALHDAGYRAVLDRLDRLGQLGQLGQPGPCRILDVGCGEGFESLRFAGPGRQVLAIDYASEATEAARRTARGLEGGAAGSTPADDRHVPPAFSVAQMDALALGIGGGAFDVVCSSHLVEHFSDPSAHVVELARVTAATGTAFFLTPNAPADFENPFHLHLFGPEELRNLLRGYFHDVWVGGVDATERVKEDFAARRAKAEKLLRLDFFDIRHRIPRIWYVTLYTRLLPVAYALVARSDRAEPSGSSAEEWFVTDDVDETTLVLFAVCRRPRR